jgi:hypothetical protein
MTPAHCFDCLDVTADITVTSEYHLCLLDSDRKRVLLRARRDGGALLALPTMSAHPRRRAVPTILEHLQARGVHAWIESIWLGDLDSAAGICHYFVQAEVLRIKSAATSYWRWHSLEDVQTAPEFRIPMASSWTIDRARTLIEWALQVLRMKSSDLTSPPRQIAASPSRLVLCVNTKHGACFIKASTDGRFTEALATQLLQAFLPRRFPRTLAFDARGGTWLMDHAGGRPLNRRLTRVDLSAAIEAVGEVRDALRSSADALQSLGAPHYSPAYLTSTCGELLRHCEQEPAVARGYERVDQIAERLRRSDLPVTWMHGDLAAENVFVDNRAIRFIDLERTAVCGAILDVNALLQLAPASDRVELASLALRRWVSVANRAAIRHAVDLADAVGPLVQAASRWDKLVSRARDGEIVGRPGPFQRLFASQLVRQLDQLAALENHQNTGQPSTVP